MQGSHNQLLSDLNPFPCLPNLTHSVDQTPMCARGSMQSSFIPSKCDSSTRAQAVREATCLCRTKKAHYAFYLAALSEQEQPGDQTLSVPSGKWILTPCDPRSRSSSLCSKEEDLCSGGQMAVNELHCCLFISSCCPVSSFFPRYKGLRQAMCTDTAACPAVFNNSEASRIASICSHVFRRLSNQDILILSCQDRMVLLSATQ